MTLSFKPGRNCWRVDNATRLAVIVDGSDYFRALRCSLLQAEHLISMVGWDFDFDLELLPGESDADGNAPDGLPNRMGPFLNALAERSEKLDIYLLKWSGGTLISPSSAISAAKVWLLSPDQIHFCLDGHHPIGACHHQKIVVIDDSLAFCGGIDVTAGRWDTSEHLSDDPRRTGHGGKSLPPWHDATTVISGPAANGLGKLARERWERGHGAEITEKNRAGADIWPDGIEAAFENVPVAIARTEPPTADHDAVAEIEALYLDMFAAAKNCIYLESQYFSSDGLAEALAARLIEKDGPDVIILNPEAAHGLIEDRAMHTPRSRLLRYLQDNDPHDRLRMVYPANARGEPIYVHAKICIIDDTALRLGSANLDRRSLGFDTECDVALSADAPSDRAQVTKIRNALLAEHLGCGEEQVSDAIAATGRVALAIDHLSRKTGRSLRPIEPREMGWLGQWLGESRLFDPRYRRSAASRLRPTMRHVAMGLAGAAAIWWIYRRRR